MVTKNSQPAEQPMEVIEPKAQQVRWIGDPGTEMLPRERMITVGDWKAVDTVNMERAKPISWNAWNNYTVPREEFSFLSDHEFARFVEADPSFVVEDVPE